MVNLDHDALIVIRSADLGFQTGDWFVTPVRAERLQEEPFHLRIMGLYHVLSTLSLRGLEKCSVPAGAHLIRLARSQVFGLQIYLIRLFFGYDSMRTVR